MKKMHYTYLAVFLLAFSIAGCRNRTSQAPAGFEKMTAPATEYSEINYPGPGVGSRGGNEYVLPKDHGFVFLNGEKPVDGDVRLAGTVNDVSQGKVVLAGGTGINAMLYNLPLGQQLALKSGEEISISFTRGRKERINDFMIVDSAGNRLLHASGRVNSLQPVRVMIAKGLDIYQHPVASAGVPSVSLQWKNKTTEVGGKGAINVEIDGQKYKVIILQSQKSQTEPGNELTAEWDGYYLEFAIVRL